MIIFNMKIFNMKMIIKYLGLGQKLYNKEKRQKPHDL